MKKECLFCKKVYSKKDGVSKFNFLKKKYCSRLCYGESKKNKSPWNKGLKLSKEHIENLVKSHLGIKMPPFSKEHRRNMAIANKGAKSHLWKGGITTSNNLIRRTLEYRLWREAVFMRDDWTCLHCKVRGGVLNADHIKPFAFFPELRFAIDNGQTLCVPCHRKTPTWGVTIKTLTKSS